MGKRNQSHSPDSLGRKAPRPGAYYNYIAQGLVIVVAVSLDIRKYLKKK